MPPKKHLWTAVIAPGLEPVVARELVGHGLRAQVGPGHVRFEAPLADAPQLVRRLRTPGRLLLALHTGKVTKLDHLAATLRGLDWAPFLPVRAELSVVVSTRGSRLRHRDTVAKKAKHALQDVQRALRKEHGAGKPGKPPPAQRVHLRLVDDQLTVNLDVGGAPLHKRGWRKVPGRAPLRENWAACLLELAGWQGDEALVDPFCGVGTIPIEAALKAADRSPHTRREFACDAWPGVRSPGAPRRLPAFRPEVPIVGSDREPMALARADEHAHAARVQVDWRRLDVGEVEAPAPTGLVVANPPYGRRLGHSVAGVYATFGRTLRASFQGWRVVFLAPDDALAAKVHREAERITTFPNGGLRVGVYGLELGGAAEPGDPWDEDDAPEDW